MIQLAKHSGPVNELLERMVRRTQKLWWIAAINSVGALISTAWVLYLVFDAAGFWRTVLAAIPLGLIGHVAGPAPLFAVAASLLCFHYSVVGLWLPLLSYCSAGIALFLDIRTSRQLDKIQDLGIAQEQKPRDPSDKLNYEGWTNALAAIVDELGADNPEIEIRVYPEHTFDHNAIPLFTARPNDLHTTLSRLRDEFGGGIFWVIVFVKGEIYRRFALLVNV